MLNKILNLRYVDMCSRFFFFKMWRCSLNISFLNGRILLIAPLTHSRKKLSWIREWKPPLYYQVLYSSQAEVLIVSMLIVADQMHFGNPFHFLQINWTLRLFCMTTKQWQLLLIRNLWLWPNSWNVWLEDPRQTMSAFLGSRLGREVPWQHCHWCNTSVQGTQYRALLFQTFPTLLCGSRRHEVH